MNKRFIASLLLVSTLCMATGVAYVGDADDIDIDENDTELSMGRVYTNASSIRYNKKMLMTVGVSVGLASLFGATFLIYHYIYSNKPVVKRSAFEELVDFVYDYLTPLIVATLLIIIGIADYNFLWHQALMENIKTTGIYLKSLNWVQSFFCECPKNNS